MRKRQRETRRSVRENEKRGASAELKMFIEFQKGGKRNF